MTNWTVQRLVTVGFSIVILAAAAMSAFSVLRLAEIQATAFDIKEDNIEGLFLLSHFQLNEQRNANAIDKIITSGDPAEQAKLGESVSANIQEDAKLSSRLEATLSDNEEKQLFEVIRKAHDQYIDHCDKFMTLIKAGKAAEAATSYREQIEPLLNQYFAALEAAEIHFKDEANTSVNNISGSIKATKSVIIVGSLLCLVASLAVAYSVIQALRRPLIRLVDAIGRICGGDFTTRVTGLRKDELGIIGDGLNRILDAMTLLVGQVQKSTIQVTTSITSMSATLKEQQTTGNEVAASSVEISATAKQISATAKELSKTMSGVASVSDSTAQLASGGQTSIATLETTMHQITAATNTITAKLGILNEKTANINSVINTINKVADQTNLLSLNAAIEAEKAGAQGLGFAVVATEIRRLADQTAVATFDIEEMVKEMQSAVAAGVMGMDKFHEEVRLSGEVVRQVTVQLADIIEQVQALTPRFEAVNDGMQSQSTAASQISETLSQLGDTTQQSAQALRNNTEAIDQLSIASRGLQEAVAQFKVAT